jgi:1-acyl-sn-glycerol-3-phosphate acyltransferase
MLFPTPDQLSCLDGFEKTAFRVTDLFNRHPVLKRAGNAYMSHFGANWVDLATRKLRYVEGTEHLRNLHPDRGVILVSNHRSFFDLYVVAAVAVKETTWIDRMYFPVRSNFFYDGPAGIAVNALMAGLAMYPPILRDGSKKSFNQYSVDFMVEQARRPGTMLGFHPEGKRSNGDDPYTLLPAHPGIGQIVRHAQPIVIPAFVLGLSNDFPRQVKGNFDGTGAPVTITYGAPVDLSSFYKDEPKLRTFKRIADRLRDEITALGASDRAMRRRLGLPILEVPAAAPAPETRSS